LKQNYGEAAQISNNLFNPTGADKAHVKRLEVKRPETHIIDTPNRSGDEEINDETE